VCVCGANVSEIACNSVMNSFAIQKWVKQRLEDLNSSVEKSNALLGLFVGLLCGSVES